MKIRLRFIVSLANKEATSPKTLSSQIFIIRQYLNTFSSMGTWKWFFNFFRQDHLHLLPLETFGHL